MAQGKETLFIPAKDIERRYKEQVKILLESNGPKSVLIDMGRLPEIYTALGIKDNELKTNGKTLLKALGIEGRNRHNVPIETIENLLTLTYDPEAVFKSLPTSLNPNAYVAVLDAKAYNQKQIIAILSPSRDGKGFTFIPSVYERNKFDQFVNKTYSKNHILYIKNKGSELWGRLQLPPRHNSEPYIKSILTKDDIVKRLNENILIKEKTMAMSISDLPETEKMVSIAEVIDKLSSRLRKDYYLGTKLPLDCIEEYKKTFGDEGYAYLENKVDSLSKYVFEKPDETGLQEIKKLIESVETPLLLKGYTAPDKKAYLAEFIEAEKEKIAAFTQGQTSSLERGNINSKENNMSDFEWSADEEYQAQNNVAKDAFKADLARDELGKPRDAAEQAFLAQVHQRKVIAEALKNGTLSCLPGPDGYADTTPAVNLVNGTYYHGSNMLFLKEHQKQGGYPTAEYVTSDQLDKAQKDYPDLSIRKGEHGVSVHFSEQNEAGEWEKKSVHLFNVAQSTKPALLKKWAEQKQEEKQQERLAYLQSQYGTNYQLPEQKQKGPGPEITCSSTDPEKYLGQYLAAVSMGGKFKASPEQAAEFSQKMITSLYEPIGPKKDPATGLEIPQKLNQQGQPVTNPFKLSKISNEASQYCKEFIKGIRTGSQSQKIDQPEQKQEQKRSPHF